MICLSLFYLPFHLYDDIALFEKKNILEKSKIFFQDRFLALISDVWHFALIILIVWQKEKCVLRFEKALYRPLFAQI